MNSVRKSALIGAVLTFTICPALAQSAPGWMPTGEWQCGPHVRIIVSSDGRESLDWLVIGAWFDNHYTVRRGQLFYNGIACTAVGNVWPPDRPRKRQTTMPESPSDRRCNDALSIEDREKYCE